jgi:hypothetical protein
MRHWIMARTVIDIRSENLGTVALGHRSYLGSPGWEAYLQAPGMVMNII